MNEKSNVYLGVQSAHMQKLYDELIPRPNASASMLSYLFQIIHLQTSC